jgi:hypothetical protein
MEKQGIKKKMKEQNISIYTHILSHNCTKFFFLALLITSSSCITFSTVSYRHGALLRAYPKQNMTANDSMNFFQKLLISAIVHSSFLVFSIIFDCPALSVPFIL